MSEPLDPGETLLPIVVKVGGSTLGAHDTSLGDIADAHRAGARIVVVHGGGAAVSEWLARSGAEAKFVRGLRVTDAATLDVVVAVLAGLVNKRLVVELCALGVPAVGLSGADGKMLQARRYDDELGFVGKIDRVDSTHVLELMRMGAVPVVAPIAVDVAGGNAQLLNVNADTAAGELAAALHARLLVFLTDVPGVMDGQRQVMARLDASQAEQLVESGVAEGGMIPKLEAAVVAAHAGCVTRIVDGTAERMLARLLAGDDVGTAVG